MFGSEGNAATSWRRAATLICVTALASISLVLATGAASLADSRGSCGAANGTHAFAGGGWVPAGTHHSFGYEAPITFRIGAAICNQTIAGGEPDQSSAWIAIEPGNGTQIVQIGFIQVIDIGAPGNVKNCSFWANGGGAAHIYSCGTSGGTTKYFRIVLDPQYADYNIEDCGTGPGYGSCVSKNATQDEFDDAWSPVDAEVSFRCGSQLMGSSGNPVDYGSSSYPVMGINTLGVGWAVHPFTASTLDTCGYYKRTVTNNSAGNAISVHTYDSRN